MPAYPNTLIYGRTADGENVPVLVEADGTVVTTGGGGGGTPGGSDTQLQYNNAGAFGGVPATWTAVGTKLELAGGFEATGGAGSYAGFPAALVVNTDPSLNWQLVITDPGAPDAFGIYSFSSGAFGFQSEDYATTGTSLTFGPNGMLVESNSRGTGAIAGKVLFAGRNMSGNGAAGALGLNNRLGTTRYVWADATDTLRVGSAMPTEDGSVSDTSGSALVLSTGPTLTAPVGITGVVGSSALTITGATQTASFPALDITQTWDNAAVTFTGVKVNVTATAAGNDSLLMDLQRSGSSQFAFKSASGGQPTLVTSGNEMMGFFSNTHVSLPSTAFLCWGSSGLNSVDLSITRDSANTLAQRNGTNGQTFRLYNTYTNASNYARLELQATGSPYVIRENAAGTGTLKGIALGGLTRVTIVDAQNNGDRSVRFNMAGGVVAAPTGRYIYADGGSIALTSGTDSYVGINPNYNPSSTSTLVGIPLRIAPTINYSNATPGAGSYEALKIAVTETALPTGTNYLIRASAGAAGTTDKFSVLNTGLTTWADAANLVFGTSTGTKIGTATSQKLGFWNATPVVQPTTAVTAAAFVANTSGIVDDTATFGGYTLGQVVAALKSMGALA